MPDVPGSSLTFEPPGQHEQGRPHVTAPTDAQVKAAYQQYMKGVIQAAHQHFHQHVATIRGSSQNAKPATSVPGVDAAVSQQDH